MRHRCIRGLGACPVMGPESTARGEQRAPAGFLGSTHTSTTYCCWASTEQLERLGRHLSVSRCGSFKQQHHHGE